MILCAAVMGVVGVAILIFAIARYGIQATREKLVSPGGLSFLLAIVLLTGALVFWLIGLDRRQDREKLDAALVQMFGRAPDKLQLDGTSLSDFSGIAEYDHRDYRIEVKMAGMHDTANGGVESKYRIVATPMGPPTTAPQGDQ